MRVVAVAALSGGDGGLWAFSGPRWRCTCFGLPLVGAAVVVLLVWIVSAPFIFARRIRDITEAINTTWLTWVEEQVRTAGAAARG